jgi:hypothetical protein
MGKERIVKKKDPWDPNTYRKEGRKRNANEGRAGK